MNTTRRSESWNENGTRAAACAVLLVVATGCGSGPAAAPSSGGFAKLRVLKGNAAVLRGHDRTAVAAGGTAGLEIGDAVSVSAAAEAVVLAGSQVHVLAEGTSLRLDRPAATGGGAGRVSLLEGVATFLLPRDPEKKHRFEAVANSVVATARGTIFRMAITAAGVQVTVVDGEVEVSADGAPAASPEPPGAAAGREPVAAARPAPVAGSGGGAPGGSGPAILKAGSRKVARPGAIRDDPATPEDVARIRTEIQIRRAELGVDLSTF
jgi:ferric-dicitrate binding protein FerR (iron transport regulator)